MGKHEDEPFNLGIFQFKSSQNTNIKRLATGQVSTLHGVGKFHHLRWRLELCHGDPWPGASHQILHLYLGPQFTHRYVSSTTIEAVVHMTSTVGKKFVQLQGQVQWVEKVWWFLHKHRESGWRSIYLVSKGNHPQMALIQVSEILYFSRFYVGGNYIVHISKKIIYRNPYKPFDDVSFRWHGVNSRFVICRRLVSQNA